MAVVNPQNLNTMNSGNADLSASSSNGSAGGSIACGTPVHENLVLVRPQDRELVALQHTAGNAAVIIPGATGVVPPEAIALTGDLSPASTMEAMDSWEANDPHAAFRSLRKKVMYLSGGSAMLMLISGILGYVLNLEADMGVIHFLTEQGIIDGPERHHRGPHGPDHGPPNPIRMLFFGLPFLLLTLFGSMCVPGCGYYGAKQLNSKLLGCFFCCNCWNAIAGVIGLLVVAWMMAFGVPIAEHWVDMCDPLSVCCGPEGVFCEVPPDSDVPAADELGLRASGKNFLVPKPEFKDEFMDCVLNAFPDYDAKAETDPEHPHLRAHVCMGAAKIVTQCGPEDSPDDWEPRDDSDDVPPEDDEDDEIPGFDGDELHYGMTDDELDAELAEFRHRFPGKRDWMLPHRSLLAQEFTTEEELAEEAGMPEQRRHLWELFSLEKRRDLGAFDQLRFSLPKDALQKPLEVLQKESGNSAPEAPPRGFFPPGAPAPHGPPRGGDEKKHGPHEHKEHDHKKHHEDEEKKHHHGDDEKKHHHHEGDEKTHHPHAVGDKKHDGSEFGFPRVHVPPSQPGMAKLDLHKLAREQGVEVQTEAKDFLDGLMRDGEQDEAFDHHRRHQHHKNKHGRHHSHDHDDGEDEDRERPHGDRPAGAIGGLLGRLFGPPPPRMENDDVADRDAWWRVYQQNKKTRGLVLLDWKEHYPEKADWYQAGFEKYLTPGTREGGEEVQRLFGAPLDTGSLLPEGDDEVQQKQKHFLHQLKTHFGPEFQHMGKQAQEEPKPHFLQKHFAPEWKKHFPGGAELQGMDLDQLDEHHLWDQFRKHHGKGKHGKHDRHHRPRHSQKWFASCELNPKAATVMHVVAENLPQLVGEFELLVLLKFLLVVPCVVLSFFASYFGFKLWRHARRGYRPAGVVTNGGAPNVRDFGSGTVGGNDLAQRLVTPRNYVAHAADSHQYYATYQPALAAATAPIPGPSTVAGTPLARQVQVQPALQALEARVSTHLVALPQVATSAGSSLVSMPAVSDAQTYASEAVADASAGIAAASDSASVSSASAQSTQLV
jgi:hypothetical protein